MAGVNYNSMAGWGNPSPVNPYTGQPDYLAGMSDPSISAAINNPTLGVTGATGTDPSSLWGGISGWLDNSGALGKKLADGSQVQGWGAPAVNLASGLAGAYFGMQQLGLAKDTLAQNKQQFQLNFDAQKKTTNASLEDRQRARVASNPNAYQSVGAYMQHNGI